MAFKLPTNETITVTPIARGNSMIKNPEHVGYFMYPDTMIEFTLPRSVFSGNWIQCLTEEEQKFLEKELKADLSFSKSNNFWKKRPVRIRRTDELLTSGFKIDISNADGYLDYKILTAQGCIATSWDKRNDSLEYRFALVKSGEKLSEELEEVDTKTSAFEKFVEMKNNKPKLYDFLLAYGAKPDKNSSIEFLRTEVGKIVDKKPVKFLEIVDDKDYEFKVFLNKCLTVKAIKIEGKSTYRLGYGSEDTIGRTLQMAIEYLKDPKNQVIYLELQARIENKE